MDGASETGAVAVVCAVVWPRIVVLWRLMNRRVLPQKHGIGMPPRRVSVSKMPFFLAAAPRKNAASSEITRENTLQTAHRPPREQTGLSKKVQGIG
jgi:hypothetical protein